MPVLPVMGDAGPTSEQRGKGVNWHSQLNSPNAIEGKLRRSKAVRTKRSGEEANVVAGATEGSEEGRYDSLVQEGKQSLGLASE